MSVVLTVLSTSQSKDPTFFLLPHLCLAQYLLHKQVPINYLKDEWINVHVATYEGFIAQLVKNPPAMQETPVRFLGQENLLEKG